jgi:hypothetical protein
MASLRKSSVGMTNLPSNVLHSPLLFWDQESSGVVRKNGCSRSCHNCVSREVSAMGAFVSLVRFGHGEGNGGGGGGD